MNYAIELHDSTIAQVIEEGPVAIIHFRPAYIHESEGVPGTDAGIGIAQEAELRISNADIGTAPTNCPCTINAGTLKVGKKFHDNVIPLPMLGREAIAFECTTNLNEKISGRGSGIAIVLTGERQFVDSYLGECAP